MITAPIILQEPKLYILKKKNDHIVLNVVHNFRNKVFMGWILSSQSIKLTSVFRELCTWRINVWDEG